METLGPDVLKHEVISPSDAISGDLWSEIAALRGHQNRYRGPFFEPEFLKIVRDVRDDVTIYLGRDGQGLAYCWPLHLSRSGVARGLGGPFSDRNGVMLRPDQSFDVAEFLSAQNIRSFISNGFVSDVDPELKFFETGLNNEAYLAGDAPAFLENQKQQYPSHFKSMRRRRRNLVKDFSEVTFQFDDQSDATFDHIIEMKRSQYHETRRHDVLRPSWVKNMFSRLRECSGKSLRLRTSSLFLDGEFAAGEINLESAETLHGWIVVYNPAFSKYSPGKILLEDIMTAMPEHGLDYYDLGIDGDDYKKYLTNKREPLGFGTIHSGDNSRHLMRCAWAMAESKAPVKVGNVMGRTRRRFDQILSTETNTVPRLRGFVEAMKVEI